MCGAFIELKVVIPYCSANILSLKYDKEEEAQRENRFLEPGALLRASLACIYQIRERPAQSICSQLGAYGQHYSIQYYAVRSNRVAANQLMLCQSVAISLKSQVVGGGRRFLHLGLDSETPERPSAA